MSFVRKGNIGISTWKPVSLYQRESTSTRSVLTSARKQRMEYESWKQCGEVFNRERDLDEHREIFAVVSEYITRADQELLMMYVDYNFSPTAIAQALGLAKSTVFYQIKTNLRRIQQCLPPQVLNELRNIL